MTRLIAAIFVTATVSACADTTTLSTKNVSVPATSTTAAGMDNPFTGLMPQ